METKLDEVQDASTSIEAQPQKPRKTGLIIGVVAAVALVAAGVAAGAMLLSGNSEAMLAEGWKNTSRILTQRYAAGPMPALMSVVGNCTDDYKIGFELSDLELYGETLRGSLTMDLYTQSNMNFALLANTTWSAIPVDMQWYYTDTFIGVGSEAILGSDTIYGGTPGKLAEEVKGSQFDPETGLFPIDIELLQEFDDSLNGILEEPYDIEGLRAAATAAAERYTEFVRSVKPVQSRGTVPISGADATVLTCTYPGEVALKALRDISDAYFKNEAVVAYYNTLERAGGSSGLYNMTETVESWYELLDALETDYSGDITVRYYLVDKAVAYLDISCEPTHDDESVKLEVFVDFGLDGDTLDAQLSASTEFGSMFQITLTSEEKENDGTVISNWSLAMQEDGGEVSVLAGSSEWRKENGAIRLSLSADDGYAVLFRIDAKGTLAVEGTDRFQLTLDSATVDDGWMPVTFGLGFGMEHSTGVPQPEKVKNVFELTEDEVVDLLLAVDQNMTLALGD